MTIPFEKKVREYIENFTDEMIVTVFDAEIGLTLVSMKVGELKEKGIFNDYTVKYFYQYDENVALLGVIKNEGNKNNHTKLIS